MKSSYKAELALPPGITFEVNWQADEAVDQEAVNGYVDTLGRPDWYDHDYSNSLSTRLYMLEVYQPFKTISIDGRLTRVWTCEDCKQPVLYEGVQIGHRRKWRDELKHAGVITPSEAKAAFNNLRNLRVECSTCNQSHDWE